MTYRLHLQAPISFELVPMSKGDLEAEDGRQPPASSCATRITLLEQLGYSCTSASCWMATRCAWAICCSKTRCLAAWRLHPDCSSGGLFAQSPPSFVLLMQVLLCSLACKSTNDMKWIQASVHVARPSLGAYRENEMKTVCCISSRTATISPSPPPPPFPSLFIPAPLSSPAWPWLGHLQDDSKHISD